MATAVIAAPDSDAIAEILDELRRYPAEWLQEAAKTARTDKRFVEKRLYESKELAVLQTYPFWKEEANRFSLFPIKHKDVWQLYREQKASFWTTADITLAADEFDALGPDIKRVLKHIMGFFNVADGMVDENLITNILPKIPNQEARCTYLFQAMMENIHSEMYSRMIDVFLTDPEERDQMFNAALRMDAVKQKTEWVRKWMTESMGVAQNLAAFAIVEAQMFPAMFAIIFWLRSQRVKLPGFFLSNDFISRDEGSHGVFAGLIYREYIPAELKLSRPTIVEMVEEAVSVDVQFVSDALGGNVFPGMSVQLLKTYIQFIADYTMTLLGYDKLYHAKNPFPFMDNICLQGKTDFFAKRVPEYRREAMGDAPAEDFMLLDGVV